LGNGVFFEKTHAAMVRLLGDSVAVVNQIVNRCECPLFQFYRFPPGALGVHEL
jgi:hypothetical protein